MKPARTILFLACLQLVGCEAPERAGPESGSGPTISSPATPNAVSAPETSREWFTEAETTGIDFVHVNGMSGEFYFPEIMGPGVAMIDYDGDGYLDLFFPQGQMLGPGPGDPPERPGRAGLQGRLYRNDTPASTDRPAALRFTDVTEMSGVEANGYGLGAAAGDFTNDGCVDLYVTNLGPNQLFRNNCDGTFTDVSTSSETDDGGFGVSAAFLDYDRDGWLDLFVGNYAGYDITADVQCVSVTGGRDYCPPRTYGGQPDRLYRNQGDSTFADATATAFAESSSAPALGVVTADFDGDGWIDIYVANDDEDNQLWLNQQDGTFLNRALVSGAAVNADGDAEASMGVDAGDFDNDGDEDLFISHLTTETNTLYVNDGSAVFVDRTAASGLGAPSVEYTGFGAAWLDFDGDRWLDLFVVNGTVTRHVTRGADEPFPYDQTPQLFRNLGNGRFEEVSRHAGELFATSAVGRGAAFGDLDNDGDTDVVVTNTNGPARVFVNQVGNVRHWLGLKLSGPEARPRDMLGARVMVSRADEFALWRRARSDGSYASANDPRVLVGLDDSAEPATVRVLWPDGQIEEWTDVPVDRWTTLTEGTGQ